MTELRQPEEIRRDIEHSRAELAAAIEALGAKLNVKARARQKADGARQFAASLWNQHRLLVIAAGTAMILIVVRQGTRNPQIIR